MSDLALRMCGTATSSPPVRSFERPVFSDRSVGCLAASENHDAAFAGQPAVVQLTENLAAVERVAGPKCVAPDTERATIRESVGDNKDDSLHTAVASLQTEASVESLDVANPGLRLGSDSLAVGLYHGIPCPTIAGNRQRHLSPHDQPTPQPTTKAAQDGDVCRVPHRIPARKRPDGQIETYCSANSGEKRNPGSDLTAALDAPDRRVRNRRRGSHLGLAEPSCQSRVAHLSSKRNQHSPRHSPGSIAWAFAAGHREGASQAIIHSRFTSTESNLVR